MARLESIAVGGYFPTPPHIVDLIAAMLEPNDGASHNVIDPCAGEGGAVYGIAGTFLRRCGRAPSVFTCEMEKTRHAALVARAQNTPGIDSFWSERATLRGDAFRISVHEVRDNGHLLYLNPPYDLDPVHARLEERFLSRFTRLLDTAGGLLVFVVPFYALDASVGTLSREYDVTGDGLGCYRFPDADFGVYKQIVLFARRVHGRIEPSSEVSAQVRRWATSVDDVSVLGTDPDLRISVYGSSWGSRLSWDLAEVDVLGLLARAAPWKQRARPGAPDASVPHILSELPVEDLSFRSYPLATPPRPAHIAAGIASGLFNGRRVSGNGPDLLVKGVFDREYKTVEEKKNKDGDVTSVVQVQQPKLVTTVLDLEARSYRSLNSAGLQQLLEDYGTSLMGVMREQCPVLYDPLRDHAAVSLAPISRQLFTAQAHTARALVRLLTGPARAAILLGEIGSGKTGTALSAAKTVAPTGRVLVLCPPHLLQSWRNEAAAVVPEATVTVLESVADVDAFVTAPRTGLAVAVLSRETAKLGHGWVSVTGACPKCGSALPSGDLAKKRARCAARPRSPADPLARAMLDLAIRLAPAAPKNDRVMALLDGNRNLARARARWAEAPRDWIGFDQTWVARTAAELTARIATVKDIEHDPRALGALLAGQPDDTLEVVIRGFAGSDHWAVREIQAAISLLFRDQERAERLEGAGVFSGDSCYMALKLHEKFDRCANDETGYPTRIGRIKRMPDGITTVDGDAPGGVEAAIAVLMNLVGKWHTPAEPCGEPLFQAVPEPRRMPLATYIAKRHPRAFDLLILDEGHEYATDGSAQERAAHRLTALGMPTILATGSIMNGYAASLFSNMWALSADFRKEFGREESARFVDRYGYRKRILSEKDKQTGKVVAFGSHTDRVERTERAAGDAPGVLPLFLFRHLLSISVTLHKTDLALDLPPCRQIRHDIAPGPELLAEYSRLLSALKAAIKADQFQLERSGKLFGQLSELPSFLDRAWRDFEVRYPESLGSELVARADALPGNHEKETWMLDTLRAELAEGRNVMVFCWHVDVLPRLQRLIWDELGEDAPILLADKVATGKRQAWIDAKIVKPCRRIMLANPVCIQTGLNNLVHFSSQIWIENPACNPTIFRQAIGRVDRIGQRATETRIHLPVYVGTLQEQLYGLLLRKVAVAVSADGLDPESALLAAGAGEDDGYLSGLSLGKQLWEMMTSEAPAPKPRKRKASPKRAAAPARPARRALDIDRLWASRRADNDVPRSEAARMGERK